MTETIFPSVPPPHIAVRSFPQCFAVRRIFCIGRNYAAHIQEMGGSPKDQPPVFFNKAAVHLIQSGENLPYPPRTHDLHHEVELVLAIGNSGFELSADEARAHIWAYGCGLDMTRRDLQSLAKKSGGPWALGKDFPGGAVLGELIRAEDIGHPTHGEISLSVNGEQRQRGDLSQMIWTAPEIVSQLSNYYRLEPGDLIFSGTPQGVGPVEPGDLIRGQIQGVGSVELKIVAPL